jgi:hypothetical protein
MLRHWLRLQPQSRLRSGNDLAVGLCLGKELHPPSSAFCAASPFTAKRSAFCKNFCTLASGHFILHQRHNHKRTFAPYFMRVSTFIAKCNAFCKNLCKLESWHSSCHRRKLKNLCTLLHADHIICSSHSASTQPRVVNICCSAS